jgi:predicted aconitase
MLELILNGKAPEAIIFERREDILTLGVMIAEEVFNQSIPVLVLKKEDFRQLLQLNGQMIYVDDDYVSTNAVLKQQTCSVRDIDGGLILETTPTLEGIKLSTLDQELLRGDYGEASRIAIRIVLRMAHLLGATRLMDITQVHVDGCVYTGPATLALAEKLRDLGGQVRVPTTLNSISVDQKRWRALGVDVTFGEAADALGKAYVDMGAKPTYTCAPYQLESAPKLGEQVAWAESNAVVYANSVLGARTMKYPDFLDISIALTGRAPKGGPHVYANRLASMCVEVVGLEETPGLDDSFPPLLGYYVGTLATSRIPVILGLDKLGLSTDDLRAFGAAFATVSSAPMFHIVGVTPEATTLEAVATSDFTTIQVKPSDLCTSWDKLNSAPTNQPLDLVSLGNPHFSLPELRKLADLCQERKKADSIAVIVTCGRSIYKLAEQAGLVDRLQSFGVQILTDTCWCMVTEPVIPRKAKTIMTNSGKYAHYGPGLTGRGMYFGSLAGCVDAACSGRYGAERPEWLQDRVVE